MKLPPLILASISPRRKELLQQMGVEFSVMPSSVPELHDEQLTAWEISQLNACRKARPVAKKFPDALVLSADTLVYHKTKLYGKPANRADAARMLVELQGKTHQVVTGMCLLHLRSHKQKVFAEMTDVTFRPLTRKQIENYLTKINPLDKAGAYAIQDHGELIVEKISGSFSNVVGLPIEMLRQELSQWRQTT
jgi:septum formation protein